MDIPSREAVKNIPFIVLGIWPVNLLTLLARDHAWGWNTTPEAIIGLWEWGLLVSLSLTILIELGVEMFVALARYRQRIAKARAEGLAEGHAEGLAEGRAEGLETGREIGLAEARSEERTDAGSMLTVLNAAARTNPDLLPSLLEKYRKQILNGAAHD